MQIGPGEARLKPISAKTRVPLATIAMACIAKKSSCLNALKDRSAEHKHE